MSRGQRIKQRLKEMDWTYDHLTESCGWKSKSRVSNYAGDYREPSNQDIRKMAKAMGVTPQWIEYGEQPKFPTTDVIVNKNSEAQKIHNEVEARVPVISWNEVTDWITNQTDISKRKFEYIDCSLSHEGRLFALRIKNDAMVGIPKSFNPESIIIIDPLETVRSGDYILIVKQGSSEAFLRQYVEDGGQAYLKALNNQYPSERMTKDYMLCGVVVEHKDLRARK